MKQRSFTRLLRIVRREEGQALPWMVFLMVLFLGMAGLTLDLGRAYVCYRELQASADAAALAGANELGNPDSTVASVKAAAMAYSSASGSLNANGNFSSITVTPTPTCFASLNAKGLLCTATATGNNGLTVVESGTLPTYLIQALQAFGLNPSNGLTLNAQSSATVVGGPNDQYNIALVIDTTASMGGSDGGTNCSGSKISCALGGVQTLLQYLTPCTVDTGGNSKAKCTAFDTVSMFTFPNVTASTASKDTTCPTSNPTIQNYYAPVPGSTWSAPTGSSATYQITTFLNDWSSTNSWNAPLSTSSTLSIAAGASGSSKCGGLQTPGGVSTYYAGAIYAAQASLMAQQALNPTTKNAIILLSDGDAQSTDITIPKTTYKAGSTVTATDGTTMNFNVTYPATTNECQQAIDAASNAKAQGTRMIVIGYGASTSGCSKDTSGPLKGISPCTTLKTMASSASDFYSDKTGSCPGKSSTTLNGIFKAITYSFTTSRLVPNTTT